MDVSTLTFVTDSQFPKADCENTFFALFLPSCKLPVSVFIDEEGVENIICAYFNEVFIIVKNGDVVEYKKIDMDFNLFRKDIINGIEKYLNEWINWNMIDDVEALKNRENELNTKLSIAKESFKKYI